MPNQLQDSLSVLPAVDFSERTGFKENWSNALGLAMAEDLPLTSRAIPSITESMRKSKLVDYHKTGEITDDEFNYYINDHGQDWDGFAEYANTKKGLTDAPTKAEYEQQKLDEYANYRKTSQAVFDKQNGWGMIGQFAGTAHAMALDPMYAIGFFTGYGGAATALQAAGRVALIEGGIEAVAQPLVYNWKHVVGADYSGADALMAVVGSAIGGGALAGVGKGIENMSVKSVKKLLDKYNAEALDSIKHVLDTADPEDLALPRLKADENVDVTSNKLPPKADADPDINAELSAKEIDQTAQDQFDQYHKVLFPDDELEAGLDDLGKAQKNDRFDELTQKERTGELDEIEMDELDMLTEELKTKPGKEDVVGAEQVPELDEATKRAMEAPIVKDAMNVVTDFDAKLKAIEGCF